MISASFPWPQLARLSKLFVPCAENAEKLVEHVEPDVLSGHQLRDIMSTNFTLEKIKEAIILKMAESKSLSDKIMSIHLMSKPLEEEETEEDKKERIGFPKYDHKQLMKEVGCEEQIPKLEENQIDAETFWELTEGEFESLIEIKSYGKRKNLMKRIGEIKKEHEKRMEELHKQAKRVSKEDVQALMKEEPKTG